MRAKLVYVVKALARRLVWGTAELFDRSGGDDELLPPRRLSFVGRGDFRSTGEEYLGHFRELGGLKPSDRVLDQGCGIGRMAIPLMGYLEGGSYAGFDVGKEMIRWCQREITPRRPEFEFTWAPIHNRKYNPFGTLDGDQFRFPYPDSSFDFTFATSLFTHLLKGEVEHYLAETARVLRPGGTCLMTFFILDAQARAELDAGRTAFDFRHPVEGGLTTDPRQPEEAIAFDVDVVREMFSAAGLSIREPFNRGQWSNVPGGVAGQDVVVASRPV